MIKALPAQKRRVVYCIKNDLFLMGNIQEFDGADFIVLRIHYTSDQPPSKTSYVHGVINGSVTSYDTANVLVNGRCATWIVEEYNLLDPATPVDEFVKPKEPKP